MLTVSLMFPEPEAVHDDPAEATQVQVNLFAPDVGRPAGKLSTIEARLASLGPLLSTTIV
jgi:hypothetical protein